MNAYVLVIEIMASHAARVDEERFIICIRGVYYYTYIEIYQPAYRCLWWYQAPFKAFKESESAAKAADDTRFALVPNAWRGVAPKKGGRGKGGPENK